MCTYPAFRNAPLILQFSDKQMQKHTDIVTFTKKSDPSKILINKVVVSGRGVDAVDKAPIRGWEREVSGFHVL